jgi:hypothetical protein
MTEMSSSSMAMAMIKQNATTADYRLMLVLGPPAEMLSMNQTATATAGEVMVSGQMMSMHMEMANTYHLEVHIYNLANGAVVTNQPVTITITNDTTNQTQTVPVVEMYDITIGPSDNHFGNNVNLPPGNYTVTVTVAGETATFHITLPAS